MATTALSPLGLPGAPRTFTAAPAYARIADDAAFTLGSGKFCIEIVATAADVGAGVRQLAAHGELADRCWMLQRDGASLELYLSSDGSTWDIASGVVIGALTTATFYATLERMADGGEIVAYLNGAEGARIATSAALHDSAGPLVIGRDDAATSWDGTVLAARVLPGNFRYGAEHEATATPFADSDAYGAGAVYSENFALHWGDYVTNPVYGMGASISGLSEAKAWCDQVLEEGCEAVAQGHGSLLIVGRRQKTYWADLLAEYANCVWFPYGSELRIQADNRVLATTPSGQEICLDAQFDSAASWTGAGVGDDWAVAAGVATIDGSQAAEARLTQALVTEAGVEYAPAMEIVSIDAGTLALHFAGAEVVAPQSAPGVYPVLAEAVTAADQVELVASADCIATVNWVSVRRSYWLDEGWIEGSLNIQAPSDIGSPTSMVVNYAVPDDNAPAWRAAAVQQDLPGITTGARPFIQTTVDYPGLQNASRANNKCVRRLGRNFHRLTISYRTRNAGMLRRIGDAVQLSRALRGVDLYLWVESVEMVEYGLYQVQGVSYAAPHFTMNCYLDLGIYACDSLAQSWFRDLRDDPYCLGIWVPDGNTINVVGSGGSSEWYFDNLKYDPPVNDGIFYGYGPSKGMVTSFLDTCEGTSPKINDVNNPQAFRLLMSSSGNPRSSLTQTYIVAAKNPRADSSGLGSFLVLFQRLRYRVGGTNYYTTVSAGIYARDLTSNTRFRLNYGGGTDINSDVYYDMAAPQFYGFSFTVKDAPQYIGGDWLVPIRAKFWIAGEVLFEVDDYYDIVNSAGEYFQEWRFNDAGQAGCDQTIGSNTEDTTLAGAVMLEREPTDAEMARWYAAYRNNFNPPLA